MDRIGIDWRLVDDLQLTARNEIERAKFFLEVVQDESRN